MTVALSSLEHAKIAAVETIRDRLPMGWKCPPLIGSTLASVTSPGGKVIYRMLPGGSHLIEPPSVTVFNRTHPPHPLSVACYEAARKEGDSTVTVFLCEGEGRSVPSSYKSMISFRGGVEKASIRAASWIVRDARERYRKAGAVWVDSVTAKAKFAAHRQKVLLEAKERTRLRIEEEKRLEAVRSRNRQSWKVRRGHRQKKGE